MIYVFARVLCFMYLPPSAYLPVHEHIYYCLPINRAFTFTAFQNIDLLAPLLFGGEFDLFTLYLPCDALCEDVFY